jgi:hypothetical protein
MKASIYISRKVLNYQDIIDWAREAGFKSMMPVDSLHVTVVYCKHKVDWNTVDRDQPEMILIPGDSDEDETQRAVHNFNGGACVLELVSDELLERNEALRELGIHSKFPDYRCHITISYHKPKGMKVEKIAPYRGPLVLGPEKIMEASQGWKEEYKEIDLTGEPEDETETLHEETLYDFDPDKLYDIFKTSYDEATGASWSKEKFMQRARNWTFYGDETGFVAFRQQASGMRKLVGVAGDTAGVVKGLKRLMDEGQPTWGAVSDRLAAASKRFGLIAPHKYLGGPMVIKMIMKSIPASVFGGVTPVVNADGGVTIDYDDTGSATKYFVANKAYFKELVTQPQFRDHIQNSIALKFINKVLG